MSGVVVDPFYKPLPDCVKIKKDKRGKKSQYRLYLKEDVVKGFSFGLSHVEVYVDSLDAYEIIQTPVGGFLKVSKNYNCVKVPEMFAGRWYLCASRCIKRGEELTLKPDVDTL